jgi:hypothetical protein
MRAMARVSARGIHHAVAPPRYLDHVARPRISDEPRVTTAVRLPASLHDRLRDRALERDVSVNLLVTKAVEAYLDQLPPVGEIAP